MTISANTIFHFTDSKESLMGILSDGFQVHLCRETITLKDKKSTKFIPMVSFCDVPLSQIKEHMGKYGSYGIGMSKEWALKKSISPVLYFPSGVSPSTSFRSAYFEAMAMMDIDGDEGTMVAALKDVMRYVKNYEGPLVRKGKVVCEKYRFYDEREWRYVPIKEHFKEMFLFQSATDQQREEAESILSDHTLGFHADDVRYIIISDESEIHTFIRHLQDVKGERYTQRTVEKILTRILTADQINNDF